MEQLPLCIGFGVVGTKEGLGMGFEEGLVDRLVFVWKRMVDGGLDEWVGERTDGWMDQWMEDRK